MRITRARENSGAECHADIRIAAPGRAVPGGFRTSNPALTGPLPLQGRGRVMPRRRRGRASPARLRVLRERASEQARSEHVSRKRAIPNRVRLNCDGESK